MIALSGFTDSTTVDLSNTTPTNYNSVQGVPKSYTLTTSPCPHIHDSDYWIETETERSLRLLKEFTFTPPKIEIKQIFIKKYIEKKIRNCLPTKIRKD